VLFPGHPGNEVAGSIIGEHSLLEELRLLGGGGSEAGCDSDFHTQPIVITKCLQFHANGHKGYRESGVLHCR
jgi:hypothetical protein